MMAITNRAAAAGPTTRERRTADQLNRILTASGLAVGKASTQIYAQPNRVHIIAPADLAVLAQHGPTLASSPLVTCDFAALSVVLWGMLLDVARQLDEAALELKVEIDRHLDVLRGAKYRASKMAQERAQKDAAKTSTSLTSALSVEAAGAAPGSVNANTPSLQRAARLAGTSMPLLSPASTPDDVYDAIYPGLHQLARVTLLLRSLEEPSLRGSMERRVHITQINVDTMSQLVLKLSELLTRIASTPQESPSLGILGRPYTKKAHSLARMTELGLASVLLLLTAFASRPIIDLSPAVAVYFCEPVWAASGLGELSTESYCRGLRGLIEALLPRQKDFEDNVEAVGAHLLLHRLAKRPAYRPDAFRYLYFAPSERDAVLAADSTPGAPFLKEIGLLLTMSRVQTNVEFLFFPPPPPASADRRNAGVSAKALARLRAATQKELSLLEEEEAMLSFPQLLVLAAVSGMPEVDLTAAAPLTKRATATQLTTDATLLEGDRSVSFLRLLLAYTYTVPTTGGASHSFLSTESVTALFQSIAIHIFQMPLFDIEDGRYISQHHVQGALRTSALINVVRFNIVNARLEAGPQPGPARAASPDRGEVTSSPADVPNDQAKPQPTTAMPPPTAFDRAKASTAADLIAIDASRMLESMYRTNNNREEMRLAGRTGGQTFTDALRAVTLNNVHQLFTLFDNPAFVQQANFAMALHGVATIYALRVLHPVSGVSSEMDRRRALALIQRMQQRLARIPLKMNRHDVTSVFVTRLVPLATPARVAHGNRLELGLMEAYLRSLATSSAANAIREGAMAKHWVDVALPCLTNRSSAALSIAAHDFYIAPFLAHKSLSLLFVGTYVSVFIPTSSSLYGEPNLPLLKRFATFCRAACQGLETVDNTELQEQIDTPGSLLHGMAVTETARDAFRKLTPTSAVLLIVSALFDKLCMVLNGAAGFSAQAQERFSAYFSSLVNLLQCANTSVLQRVCASIEAIEVEHLQGMGQVQAQFLKYIGSTVDQVRGSTKKDVAEWYLNLTQKVTKGNGSKL